MGKTSIVRSAGLVSACTLASRVLGLVRDTLCSHFFGASMLWDAFSVAFRIPNLFRRLFGEGALTAAFLPAFVERMDGNREAEAHALLNRLVTALALFLGLAALAGAGLTWLAPADEKTALTMPLLRIMLPYLPLICVAAILGAALNGLRHYLAPAIAPVALNVVLIGALFAFQGSVEAQAWAVVAGGVLTVAVLAVPLLRRGVPLRPRFDFAEPGFCDVLRRFLPVVFGLAPVQLNELVGSLVVQYAVPGHGAVSAVYYGNQLVQLPLALVGTAVATVVFPLFASPKEDFADVYRRAMRLVLFLALPAAAGLMVLARPIVDLLFLHGSFTAADAERAAGVVLYYGAGLWCFCANQVQVRAFYARKDTLSPVKVSAAMVLLNLVLTVALVGPLRERAVALANSATGLASFVALNVLLRHRHGDVRLASLAGMALRCTLAAAGMAAAARGTWRLTASWGEATIAAKAARALVPVAAGVASYALLAALLRIDEARLLLRRRHADR